MLEVQLAQLAQERAALAAAMAKLEAEAGFAVAAATAPSPALLAPVAPAVPAVPAGRRSMYDDHFEDAAHVGRTLPVDHAPTAGLPQPGALATPQYSPHTSSPCGCDAARMCMG